MHPLQEKILALVDTRNLGQMTLREIGELVGERFPQKIKHHLTQLEKKGLIKTDKYKGSIAKTMSGLIKNTMLISVPIVGAANCGPAEILAETNIQGYLKVSSNILSKKRKDIFAIRASGLSMNNAEVNGKKIEDGDYLIVDGLYKNPKNGDIVLSVIDGMANIKKYIKDDENDQIVLMSDSTKDFAPIYIHSDDDFMVNGKVIQVIKKPRIK